MSNKKEKEKSQLTLGLWLIRKYNTDGWRAGKVTGIRHPMVDQEMIDAVGGRTNLLRQAADLEQKGIITPVWKGVRTDISKIHFSMEKMEQLCMLEGVENPREQLEKARDRVLAWKAQTTRDWLVKYYDSLLDLLDRGKIPPNAQDEELFQCLNGIASGEGYRWKHIFSTAVLGDSKKFENHYEGRALTVLRDHSPYYVDGMSDGELLAEHGIETYSQTLEWKGAITYQIQRIPGEKDAASYQLQNVPKEKEVLFSTRGMVFGSILNAQTLKHAIPISADGICQVITIENKANYESMIYDPATLYIYTHGFFSPSERNFLKKLAQILPEHVRYYHWGDMDYGGIRIFQFIYKNVFPKLEPLYMDRAAYESACRAGAGIPLKKEKREKLLCLEAGKLEELKSCILEHGMEIEQEVLIAKGQMDCTCVKNEVSSRIHMEF